MGIRFFALTDCAFSEHNSPGYKAKELVLSKDKEIPRQLTFWVLLVGPYEAEIEKAKAALKAESGAQVSIVNSEAMLDVGVLSNNSEVGIVAAEAHNRLERVAAALKA